MLSTYPVHLVYNADYAQGMGTSLRAGARALVEPEAGNADWDAVVIGLGDQPALAPATIRRLLEQYRVDPRPIVAPVYHGQRGHPVILDRSYAAHLETLDGDVGCRSLLAAAPQAVHEVDVDDPGVVLDIDTPEQYERNAAACRESGKAPGAIPNHR